MWWKIFLLQNENDALAWFSDWILFISEYVPFKICTVCRSGTTGAFHFVWMYHTTPSTTGCLLLAALVSSQKGWFYIKKYIYIKHVYRKKVGTTEENFPIQSNCILVCCLSMEHFSQVFCIENIKIHHPLHGIMDYSTGVFFRIHLKPKSKEEMYEKYEIWKCWLNILQ